MTEMPSGPSQAELTELEIAAFMGPHIKRARFALVLVGALYAVTAFLHYSDIAKLRDEIRAFNGDSPEVSAARHLVDNAYYYVVFTGIAGVANIVLAAIAGARATFAMYAAMAIFVAYTLFQLVLGIPVFIDWVWWIIAIVVGMGFLAARKADNLRRERALATATALS